MLTHRAAMLALHNCPRWQTAVSVGWGVIWVVTLGADQAFWCQPGQPIRTGMYGRQQRPHRAAMSAQPWAHRRHIVAHLCAHPPMAVSISILHWTDCTDTGMHTQRQACFHTHGLCICRGTPSLSPSSLQCIYILMMSTVCPLNMATCEP